MTVDIAVLCENAQSALVIADRLVGSGKRGIDTDCVKHTNSAPDILAVLSGDLRTAHEASNPCQRERVGHTVEKACQVPVTVPNWACWAEVSAFSNTELIMVKTTAPPVARLALLRVADRVLVVAGAISMTVPTSAVVKVALGSYQIRCGTEWAILMHD